MKNPQTIRKNSVGVSVFFPAYNDQYAIVEIVEKTLAFLPTLTGDFEIIIVNDGSSDGTAGVVDQLAAQYPPVRVIHHKHNRGYGGALKSGFSHAVKELVFYTDGDGQYDVHELGKLLPQMVDGVDVVNGYKIKRFDQKRRVILGGLYKFLARWLYGLPIRDVDCDFRLIRRRAIQSIDLVSTSGVVCTEMIYKLKVSGFHFVEVPVNHYPRKHGQSQFFTWKRVIQTAFDFLELWMKLVLVPLIRGKRDGEVACPIPGNYEYEDKPGSLVKDSLHRTGW
ncbi:MAG: glycosyltransferase family 2 protein [Acidobacteria bacterium]|nr:glycosyltransferase family 2 protein [Acidobacteriota bacterium]